MQATATKPSQATGQMTKNIVQFRNGFINLSKSGENNRALAMTILSELLQFGYVMSPEAIENVSAASREDIIAFHNEVISYLKKMTGSNRNYQAFWPGFPEQVMEKSEFELWVHQIVHYMSNGAYVPNEWTKERPTAFEQSKYTTITAGDDSKFEKIFTDLVSVNNSLTPDDMEIVKWFVNSGSKLVFPDVIPFKENLCTLAALKLDVPVKTVTDVLRIAVGLSGGDISLPSVPSKLVKMNRWSSHKSENPARANFKFAKFNRADRKFILGLLEKTNCDASEAVLKDQRWIRLGEILHPGEYKNQFPKSFAMFNAIRNEKVQSWNGKLNAAFDESFAEGLKVLSQRPGEFMRKLDSLIRVQNAPKKKVFKNSHFEALDKFFKTDKKAKVELSLEERQALVLSMLESIAPKVSNKVLFEAYSHFEGRSVDNTNRTIMIKGKRGRTKLPDLAALSPELIATVQNAITKSLVKKFATLPKLGSVYLDENLKNIPLPTNMRTASSSLKPTVRGQRTPIGNANAKVIRAFVHWFDEQGNQDIDLTGTFIGPNKMTHIGWNGQHNGDTLGCYSGDVRHRQGACAEYIDINIKAALKEGYKYVIIDANNYNGRSFETVTDCVIGYMEREHAKANEKFVPSTIANCTRLSNEASTTLAAMIDLETQEYIHLDIDRRGLPVSSHDFTGLLDAVKPYCEAPKFSVYSLLAMHVEGRGGNLVSLDEKADTYFSFEDFASSYVETLKFMGV